jgi:hypothetical protein
MDTANFDKFFDEKETSEKIKAMFNESGQVSFDELQTALQHKQFNKANEIVVENQKEIPIQLENDVRAFIKQERNKNTKERQIRRLVKKKFNIIVIPKSK